MPKRAGILSNKRIAINKANTSIVLMVGAAAFIVVFSMVASKALLDQRAYQAKVITTKKKAKDQLKVNIAEVKTLETSYKEFAEAPENVLGGNPIGGANRDGPNPRIVLDALPSKYDFPALATSVEKLLKDNNYKIESLTGTDDEIAQTSNQSSDSPQAIEMPFSVSIETTQAATKPLLQLFERSIRPIQIDSITIKGGTDRLKVTLEGKTYFQPKKTFNVKNEVVK